MDTARPMTAVESKRLQLVVEGDTPPRLLVVAGLAAALAHELVDRPGMRILMTGVAGLGGEDELHGGVGSVGVEGRRRRARQNKEIVGRDALVTTVAGNREMGPFEPEAGLAVVVRREGRGEEAPDRVAGLAGTTAGERGELAQMLVTVAVRACRRIDGTAWSSRKVTALTADARMTA